MTDNTHDQEGGLFSIRDGNIGDDQSPDDLTSSEVDRALQAEEDVFAKLQQAADDQQPDEDESDNSETGTDFDEQDAASHQTYQEVVDEYFNVRVMTTDLKALLGQCPYCNAGLFIKDQNKEMMLYQCFSACGYSVRLGFSSTDDNEVYVTIMSERQDKNMLVLIGYDNVNCPICTAQLICDVDDQKAASYYCDNCLYRKVVSKKTGAISESFLLAPQEAQQAREQARKMGFLREPVSNKDAADTDETPAVVVTDSEPDSEPEIQLSASDLVEDDTDAQDADAADDENEQRCNYCGSACEIVSWQDPNTVEINCTADDCNYSMTVNVATTEVEETWAAPDKDTVLSLADKIVLCPQCSELLTRTVDGDGGKIAQCSNANCSFMISYEIDLMNVRMNWLVSREEANDLALEATQLLGEPVSPAPAVDSKDDQPQEPKPVYQAKGPGAAPLRKSSRSNRTFEIAALGAKVTAGQKKMDAPSVDDKRKAISSKVVLCAYCNEEIIVRETGFDKECACSECGATLRINNINYEESHWETEVLVSGVPAQPSAAAAKDCLKAGMKCIFCFVGILRADRGTTHAPAVLRCDYPHCAREFTEIKPGSWEISVSGEKCPVCDEFFHQWVSPDNEANLFCLTCKARKDVVQRRQAKVDSQRAINQARRSSQPSAKKAGSQPAPPVSAPLSKPQAAAAIPPPVPPSKPQAAAVIPPSAPLSQSQAAVATPAPAPLSQPLPVVTVTVPPTAVVPAPAVSQPAGTPPFSGSGPSQPVQPVADNGSPPGNGDDGDGGYDDVAQFRQKRRDKWYYAIAAMLGALLVTAFVIAFWVLSSHDDRIDSVKNETLAENKKQTEDQLKNAKKEVIESGMNFVKAEFTSLRASNFSELKHLLRTCADDEACKKMLDQAVARVIPPAYRLDRTTIQSLKEEMKVLEKQVFVQVQGAHQKADFNAEALQNLDLHVAFLYHLTDEIQRQLIYQLNNFGSELDGIHRVERVNIARLQAELKQIRTNLKSYQSEVQWLKSQMPRPGMRVATEQMPLTVRSSRPEVIGHLPVVTVVVEERVERPRSSVRSGRNQGAAHPQIQPPQGYYLQNPPAYQQQNSQPLYVRGNASGVHNGVVYSQQCYPSCDGSYIVIH